MQSSPIALLSHRQLDNSKHQQHQYHQRQLHQHQQHQGPSTSRRHERSPSASALLPLRVVPGSPSLITKSEQEQEEQQRQHVIAHSKRAAPKRLRSCTSEEGGEDCDEEEEEGGRVEEDATTRHHIRKRRATNGVNPRAIPSSLKGKDRAIEVDEGLEQVVEEAGVGTRAGDATIVARRPTSTSSSRTRTRTRTTTTTAPTLLRTPRTSPSPVAAPVIGGTSYSSLAPAVESSLRSAALAASISSDFARAASEVASRSSASSAALVASVESRILSAASVITSRASVESVESVAATATTSLTTTAAPTTSSIASSSSRSSSSSSSSTTPSATPSSTFSSLASSTSSSSATSGAAATSLGSTSQNNNRLVNIIVPSVVVPIAILFLAMACFFCHRQRRRQPAGRPTPSSFGVIGSPQQGLFSPFRTSTYGTPAAAAGGAAGLMAQRGGGDGNASQESFSTSPSAIGVALSEPRTKWGRRSLVDVLAGGARGASGGGGGVKGRKEVVMSESSSFGGRQSSSFGGGRQSVTSDTTDSSGGWLGFGANSTAAATPYRPGQLRPVVSPTPSGQGQHYDPFPQTTIIPVPPRKTTSAWASRDDEEEATRSLSISASSDSGDSLLVAAPTSDMLPGSTQLPYGASPGVGGGGPSTHPADGGAAFLAQRSRTDTQTTDDVYYTDMASSEGDGYDGFESDGGGGGGGRTEELVHDGPSSAMATAQQPVNFGSSGSSGGGSPNLGTTPQPGLLTMRGPSPQSESGSSQSGTAKLGAGHGSMGAKRSDGSWWS